MNTVYARRVYLNEWEHEKLSLWLGAMEERVSGEEGIRYARLAGKIWDAPMVRPARSKRMNMKEQIERETVTRIVEARRIDQKQCPTHGDDLMVVSIEGAWERMRCPEKFCTFQRSYAR